MSRIVAFVIGGLSAFVFIAGVYIVSPASMIPPRLTCAMTTLDGCVMWADKARIERYKAGKAGS